MMASVDIQVGDCLELLKAMADESVQCCVTSPPYWGLRDYGVKGQIGLEKTPEEHIAVLVEIFHEVRRVLRKDGTLWVNYGDAYASNAGGYDENGSRGSTSNSRICAGTLRAVVKNRRRIPSTGLKPKDLIGLPWMLAFALRADGWYLRQDIIWHKPNPMPESCRDRCTKAHEYVFLLSKSPRYYYDAGAIREPLAEKTFTTFGCTTHRNNGGELVKADNWARDVKVRKPKEWKMPDGWDTGPGGHGNHHRNGREKGKTTRREDAITNSLYDQQSTAGRLALLRQQSRENGHEYGDDQAFGANKRSVWTVATAPFKEAHFATFPPALIKPCILAGTKPGDMVLDPFGGSGTTGMVSLELGRSATLIELNPAYAAMARRRCDVTPGFSFTEDEMTEGKL